MSLDRNTILLALAALGDEAAILERGHFGRTDKPEAVKALRSILNAPAAPSLSSSFSVLTYHQGQGHGEPQHPIKVAGGQGLTVTLPAEGDYLECDIYIERTDRAWTINISPDDTDIKLVLEIGPGGYLTVRK